MADQTTFTKEEFDAAIASYKTRVRAAVIAKKTEMAYCDEGTNEFLKSLDLRPLDPLREYRWEVPYTAKSVLTFRAHSREEAEASLGQHLQTWGDRMHRASTGSTKTESSEAIYLGSELAF